MYQLLLFYYLWEEIYSYCIPYFMTRYFFYISGCYICCILSNTGSYTLTCPPIRGDNLRALASGLSYVQVGNQGTL